MVEVTYAIQLADFGICSEIQFQNSKSNTVKDINGDVNKSSSQDIISRDIGKKELPMITLFCIRLQYSALIFYHRQRKTRK